jgi:hypothetical protein
MSYCQVISSTVKNLLAFKQPSAVHLHRLQASRGLDRDGPLAVLQYLCTRMTRSPSVYLRRCEIDQRRARTLPIAALSFLTSTPYPRVTPRMPPCRYRLTVDVPLNDGTFEAGVRDEAGRLDEERGPKTSAAALGISHDTVLPGLGPDPHQLNIRRTCRY